MANTLASIVVTMRRRRRISCNSISMKMCLHSSIAAGVTCRIVYLGYCGSSMNCNCMKRRYYTSYIGYADSSSSSPRSIPPWKK